MIDGLAWSSLYRYAPRRNRRVSSNEQPNWNDGNMDMTWLQPGETLEMPQLTGPGVIRHIWMTSHAGAVGDLDALSLRIYWDGSSKPSVQVPLGMFFAVGQGKPAPVESVPVQVSPTGSLTCYWPMPFRQQARITVTNDHPRRGTGLYWQVDWEETPDLPADILYFHAAFRCEFPAVMGRDYLVADIHGTGKYVGAVLGVTLAQDGWFGEGDDFFYIDGEEVPSLQGTGTEDYFNDAWGFRPRTGNWFGQPRWEGYAAGDEGICYRWHVLDPVHFERSLRVTLEHKGNLPRAEEGFFLERPDYLSSIAYWYQKGVSDSVEELPSWEGRNPPWTTSYLVEAFQATKAIGEARPVIVCEGMFGGRPMVYWPNYKLDASLTAPFVAPATDRYAVRLDAWTLPDGGTYDLEIDGSVVARGISMRCEEPGHRRLSLGTHVLEQGMHALCLRACPPQTGPAQIESVKLLSLPPEAMRAVKTKHEAHFVRLAIGRAIYAYRLAYGRLPDGLDALVAARLLEERFLTDENGNPLQVEREGDRLTVRAAEWTHSWQGLDPRR